MDVEALLGDATLDAVPQDLLCAATVFDIAYHPNAPFLAVGLINGAVEVHECHRTETRGVATIKLHSGGITGMEFSTTGSHLVTVSSDRSINMLDCTTQQSVVTIKKGKGNPHKFGISAMNLNSDTTVSTGDDDGLIAFWDLRSQSLIGKYHEHGDYISQMLYFEEVNQLISSSGDTCLGAYDMRSSKVIDFSDMRPDELACLAFIPATNDIICGTPSGSLPVWKYGSWARPYDVFKFHPRECECIVTYNDNIVLTGAYDGLVRVLQVYPVRRVLCHLGGNDVKQPSSHIRISHDRTVIAIARDDATIQFVDATFLSNDDELDKLRNKADLRHMQTLREANAQDEKKEAEAEDDEEDSEDDDEWTSDSEEDEEDEEEGRGEGAQKEGDVELAEEGPPQEEANQATNDTQITRKQKRDRVAAAQWLKRARKEKVSFSFERRRRRVGGFWEGLK